MEPIQNGFNSSFPSTDLPTVQYDPMNAPVVPDTSLVAAATLPDAQSISAGELYDHRC
jgi:hypothetical protein